MPTCSPKGHILQRPWCPGNMALVNISSCNGALTSSGDFFLMALSCYFPLATTLRMKATSLHEEGIPFRNSTQTKLTKLCYYLNVYSVSSPCLTRSRSFSKLPILSMANMRVWWENTDLHGHTRPEKSLLRHSAKTEYKGQRYHSFK